jgi:hypothetical protein
MAFNDAMWQKYEIGKEKQIKEPRSENWVTRNPYQNGNAGGGGRGGASPAPAADRMVATFVWLAAHGHILLGCDQSTRNYANTLARNTNAESAAVYEELRANLVPGMILQPSGIYAAARAQEAGCGYIRST